MCNINALNIDKSESLQIKSKRHNRRQMMKKCNQKSMIKKAHKSSKLAVWEIDAFLIQLHGNVRCKRFFNSIQVIIYTLSNCKRHISFNAVTTVQS